MKQLLPITLNEMIYHASSVVRGVDRALVVVDMPFGSYQGNSKEALSSRDPYYEGIGWTRCKARRWTGSVGISNAYFDSRYSSNGTPWFNTAIYL